MTEQETILDLSIEYWKILRSLERAINLIGDQSATGSLQAHHRYACSRLHALLGVHGLAISVFDGEPYEENLPLAAVNADEFDNVVDLFIERTIEPAIVQSGRVLRVGKVILRKE